MKDLIDLFSGTGGFVTASKKHGFNCLLSNDILESSKQINNLNHPNHSFLLKDLNDVDVKTEIPPHNILCGGFPCQPFSIAGEKKGFDDERSNVFWKILEILEHHKPQIVVLENVKNLHTHNQCKTFEIILTNLNSLGYHIKSAILDTSNITSIPQHRERIYIVCFLEKELHDKFNFDFKRVDNKPITDFLETDVSSKYYYSDRFVVYPLIKEKVTNHIKTNTLYQYRRFYVRENKSNVCPTLTANMGGGGHNVPLLLDDDGIRKLTPRECFNLQGFPSNYKLPDLCDGKLYQLAGNAISVPVVDLIMEKIKNIFD
jgi:DNA (cytosine-5)-methyltransferase 1